MNAENDSSETNEINKIEILTRKTKYTSKLHTNNTVCVVENSGNYYVFYFYSKSIIMILVPMGL